MTTLIRKHPRRRALGAGLTVPTATFRPPSESTITTGSTAMTLRVAREQIAAGGVSFALRDRIRGIAADRMWSLDEGWAASSAIVDGRLCIAGDVRPFRRSDCGGDPICEWGLLSVAKACNADTFGNVMFQSIRYLWCQEKLAALIAAPPTVPMRSGDRVAANAWADWCISIMRLVSLANWCTNIHPRYLIPMAERANTAAAIEEIRAGLRATPTKLDRYDQFAAQNAFTMAIAVPVELGVDPERGFAVPTRARDFDPVWFARNNQLTYTARPWPYEHFRGHAPDAFGPGSVGSSRVRDALVAWFEKNLGSGGGSGYWWAGRNVRARIMGRVGCSGPSAVCPRDVTSLAHWWGTASAQVRLCQAWAQDIIETDFGTLVSTSMQRFLDAYEAIPAHLRSLTNAQIGDARAALTATIINEYTAVVGTTVGALGAVVGAAFPPAGAFIAIVGALVTALLQILQAAGAVAVGGGELSSACIPPPVIRQIPDVGTDACDFDPRDGTLQRIADQITAITAAAARDLPTDIWFEASREGAGEESDLPDPGGDVPPPPGADGLKKALPFLLIGGAGALGLIGYAALRDKKE